ncbi:hypothetical protein [Glaesserella sp.]|uniref:hypothetical protein n=1 Tax=Glaesserella sp. TaxID=2094731 RepID=UPI0035A0133A
MSFRKSLSLALTLSASIVVAGCQGGSSLFGGTSADPRLTQDESASFFSSSGVQSCIVGGLLGAVVGGGTAALSGAEGGTTAAATIGGAAVGCGLAAGANYYYEQKRTQYANKEQRLQAEILDVQASNKAARTLISNAKTVLDQDSKNLANLDKQIKNKTLDQAQAKKQLAQADANIKALNERLANMKEKKEMFMQASTQERREGNNTKQLDAEIASLNKQISSLETLVNRASERRNAIRLG